MFRMRLRSARRPSFFQAGIQKKRKRGTATKVSRGKCHNVRKISGVAQVAYRHTYTFTTWKSLGFTPAIYRVRDNQNGTLDVQIGRLARVLPGRVRARQCVRHHGSGTVLHPVITDVEYCRKCYRDMQFTNASAWKPVDMKDGDRQQLIAGCALCPDSHFDREPLVCDNKDCRFAECWACVQHFRPVLYEQLSHNLGATKFLCLFCETRQPTVEDGDKEWITMPKKDYVQPLESLDHYNEEQSRTNPNKWCQNGDLTTLFNLYQRPDRHAVLLEAAAGNTVRALMNTREFYGRDAKDRIHVPNMDPEFAKKLDPTYFQYCTVHHCTVYAFMRDRALALCPHGFDVLADYCCSWHGNEAVKPQADIEWMFAEGVLARRNGILWLTFSIGDGNRGSTKQGLLQAIPEFVYQKAKQYGYKVELIRQMSDPYEGMVTFKFVTDPHQTVFP